MQHSLTPSFAGIIENQQQEITLDDALDDIFTGFLSTLVCLAQKH